MKSISSELLKHKQEQHNTKIIHFIHSQDDQFEVIRKIYLHQNEKVHLINLDEVVYIKSVKTYSEILTTAGNKFLSAKPLGDYEHMLLPLGNFPRMNNGF